MSGERSWHASWWEWHGLIVSAYLVNTGKARYLWVTVLPMCFVMTTTGTAAVQMIAGDWTGIATPGGDVDWSFGKKLGLGV